MKRFLGIAAVLCIATSLHAQGSSPIMQWTQAPPSGNCTPGVLPIVASTGVIYSCQGGTWAAASTGGGNVPVITATYCSISGVKCDGTTDDAAAFQTWLNANCSNAACVITGTLGKTTLWSSAAINLPNTGAAPGTDNVFQQYPLVFDGLCPAANGRWSAPPLGCFTINDTFSPTSGAKINTYGSGEVTWKNTVFEDTGSDCNKYYLYTTNTTLSLQDNAFVGTGVGGASSCSYGVRLGGTSTTIDNTTNGAFQGYHTLIRHNFFSRMQHGVDGYTYVNSIIIADNTFSADSGSSVANDGYINSFGFGTGANTNHGWIVTNNLAEQVHIPYLITLTNSEDFYVMGNSSWDGGTAQVRVTDAVSDTGLVLCPICAAGSVISAPLLNPSFWTDLSPGSPTFSRATFNLGWTLPDGQCVYNTNNICVFTGSGELKTRVNSIYTRFDLPNAPTFAGTCSASAFSGHGTSGKFTLGATNCTETLTIQGQGATHGWSCWANDETTAGVLIRESASASSTVTFAVPSGAVINDVVDFGCNPY